MSRYKTHLALALAALALSAHPAALRASGLYGFVDPSGVAHFSDQRTDSRHRMLSGTKPKPPGKAGGPFVSKGPSASVREQIERIAIEHGVDPALVIALVETESAFNPAARSSKGAVGLMQLMPDTARRYGVTDRLDTESNLRGGIRYLSDLITMFGDHTLALAAYNAGEGAVIRHGRTVPPYAETRAYVPKVLIRYAALRNAPMPVHRTFAPTRIDHLNAYAQ